MENNGIKFEIMRKYLSHSDRLSICILETTEYENYLCIRDVPDYYNDLYIYGIGMTKSEFYKIDENCYTVTGDSENFVMASCIEVVLSKEPRVDI